MAKKLSLIHLTRGLQTMKGLEDEESAIEMVAIYTATPGNLVAAKKDPSVMETLYSQAAEMPREDAEEILKDFFEQCLAYQQTIIGSLPTVTEEMLAKVKRAQGTQTS